MSEPPQHPPLPSGEDLDSIESLRDCAKNWRDYLISPGADTSTAKCVWVFATQTGPAAIKRLGGPALEEIGRPSYEKTVYGLWRLVVCCDPRLINDQSGPWKHRCEELTPEQIWGSDPTMAFEAIRDNVCDAVEVVIVLESRGIEQKKLDAFDPELLWMLDESIESGFLLWDFTRVQRYLIRKETVSLHRYDGSLSPAAACYTELALHVANNWRQMVCTGKTVSQLHRYLRRNTAAGDGIGQHLLNLIAKIKCECQVAVSRLSDEQPENATERRNSQTSDATSPVTTMPSGAGKSERGAGKQSVDASELSEIVQRLVPDWDPSTQKLPRAPLQQIFWTHLRLPPSEFRTLQSPTELLGFVKALPDDAYPQQLGTAAKRGRDPSLTPDQVIDVKQRRAKGETQASIAQYFNVSVDTIRRVERAT